MYKCKESGLTVYETFEELLNADIDFMSEYDGFYYFRLKPEEKYDNAVWKVNKKTKEVSIMYFTEYFDIEDKATLIDPKTFKRVS